MARAHMHPSGAFSSFSRIRSTSTAVSCTCDVRSESGALPAARALVGICSNGACVESKVTEIDAICTELYVHTLQGAHCKGCGVLPTFKPSVRLFSVLRNDNAPRAPSTLPARHADGVGVELAVERELLQQKLVGTLRTIWRVYDSYV